MSGDLVPRTEVDSWVAVLGPVGDLASKIASTEFAPKSLRGRAPAVAAAILAGRERGLGPMVSLAGIDVIDGRPALNAQLLSALVYRAGHRITVIESTDKTAEVKIERADGLGEATVRWTLADAQRAGLANKRNWQQWPRQMLFARALSECARMVCPDVALGLDVDATVVDAEPTRAPATVVQLQPQGTPEGGAPSGVPDVQPDTTITGPSDTVEDAEIVEDTPTELITGPQMRKLGALIGQLEKQQGTKLDRDRRRHLIRELAGLDTLDSAKDLTVTQASVAIDALTALTREQVQEGE